MRVISVFLSIYVHEYTSMHVPSVACMSECVTLLPMSFYIFVNISELIGKSIYVYLHVCVGVSSLVQARISVVSVCTYILVSG